jgi:hypothetical protein
LIGDCRPRDRASAAKKTGVTDKIIFRLIMVAGVGGLFIREPLFGFQPGKKFATLGISGALEGTLMAALTNIPDRETKTPAGMSRRALEVF